MAYPVRLLLTELGPEGTTVLNASGTLNDGTPYVDLEGTGTLAPGETTAALVIGIQPPPRLLYTFVPRVSAVVIGGSTGGELVLVPARSLVPNQLTDFQNDANRFDVNSDGRVSARDALNILNHIQLGRDLIAADMAAVIGVNASMWVDVNGDGKASALDALNVINELGRRSVTASLPAAQGEQIRRDDDTKKALDEAYASLAEEDGTLTTGDFSGQVASMISARRILEATGDKEADFDDRAESVDFGLNAELSWLN